MARDCGIVDVQENVLLVKVITRDTKKCLQFLSAHTGGLENSVNLDKVKEITIFLCLYVILYRSHLI